MRALVERIEELEQTIRYRDCQIKALCQVNAELEEKYKELEDNVEEKISESLDNYIQEMDTLT